MGKETFTGLYIDGLNTGWPIGASDQKSEGDDHIRGIKLVLQNTFPSVTGPVTTTEDELNVLDGATAGTAVVSKALVSDGSGNLDASALTWTDIGSIESGDIDGVTLGGTTNVDIQGADVTLGGDADGDVYYRASGELARLAKGTAKQALLMNAGATAPEWGEPVTADGSAGSVNFVALTGSALSSGDFLEQIAHGLGAEPQIVIVKLECTSTDGGWAAGDEVQPIFDTRNPDANANNVFIVAYADATNVNIRVEVISDGIFLPAKSAGSGVFSVSVAKWRWKVYCGLFA